MKQLKLFIIGFLLISVFSSANNESFAQKDLPEDVILSAANSLFSDVEKNKEMYENDITTFYERVDNILSPIIDFEVLIRSIIVKKNYQETSSAQKNRFQQALKSQLIRIYAKPIVEYANSKITIISSSKDKNFHLVEKELSIGQ